MTRLLVPVLAGLWLAALATSASATTTRYWDNGAGDGQWTNATNWSSNTAPASNTWAAFNSTSVANCTVGATAVTSRLTFADTYTGTIILTNSLPNTGTVVVTNTGSWTLQGNATTINGSSCTFSGAGGTMNVTENATIPDTTFSANYTINVSSGKTLTINGDLTTYTNSAVLTLSGQGNVNVTNVTMGGTDNRINLSGGGKLNVSGNLTVTNGDSLIIDGTGTIDVTGNVTDASAEPLSFAAGSTATLKVGGTMNSDFVFTKSVGCTVEFSGAGQTIPAFNYHHLKLSGSGTPALAGATDVAGTLTVGPTLNLNGQTLTLSGGALAGAGTISNATGTGTIASAVTVQNGATPTITTASGAVTCSGAWTVGQGASGTLSLTTSANALNFSSTLGVASGGTLNVNGTGTCTVASNVTKTGPIVFGSTGTLQIGGSFTGAGTLTEGTGTIDYNKAGDQAVLNETYNGLTLSGSGTKTLDTGTTTVAGTLTVGPTLAVGGQTLTVTSTSAVAGAGTITVGSGGTFNLSSSSVGPTLTLDAASTVDYTRGGVQDIKDAAYGVLTTSGGSGIKSITGNATSASGTLTLGAGTTLAIGGYSFAATSANAVPATGTITVGSGGTFAVSAASVGAVLTLDAASTVNYARAGAQDIKAVVYGNLSTSGSGTKSLPGETTVDGNITVGTGTVLDLTGAILHMPDNPIFSGDGTILSSGSTGEILPDSGTTTVRGMTIGGGAGVQFSSPVTIDTATVTLGGAMSLTGALTINGVSLDLAGNTLTLPNSPTLTGTGTLSSSSGTGHVDTGSGTITLTVAKVGGAGTVQFDDPVSVDAALQLQGTATMASTLAVTSSLDLNGKTLNLPADPTLTGGGTIKCDSGTGTLTPASGTVVLQGMTIGGTGTVQFSSPVTVNTGTTTLAGAMTVAGSTLTVDSTLDLAGKTLTMSNGTTRDLAGSGTISNSTLTGTISGAITVKDGAGPGITTATGAITCSGAWTVGQGTSGSLTLTTSANALNFSSTLSVAANGTLYLAGTGSATIAGNLTGAGAVEFQAAATLTLEANFTNSGTFTQGDGTVKYADTDGVQTIRSGAEITYKHLQLSNSYGTYPNITVSGTAKVAGTLTVSQVTETTGGGTIESSGPSLVFNAAYTTDAGSAVAFKLSDDAAQTISGTDAPVFKDLELANTSPADPNITYSNDGATLSVTGTLTINQPTRLTATSKTIDVDTVAINANFTQNSGTFQMDSGDALTAAANTVTTFGASSTFKTSGGTKPTLTGSGDPDDAFKVLGTANVDGLAFSSWGTAGFELGSAATPVTTAKVTLFKNVDFGNITSGRQMTIQGNGLNYDFRGCTFGTLGTGKNVQARDPSAANTRVRFEDRGDAISGAGAGEANDDDEDTDGNGLIDGAEAAGGAIIEWVYTANTTIAGTGSGGVVGIPTRAFSMDTYDFYSTYVIIKDYNGGSADRIYAFNDNGVGDNAYSIDIDDGDIVGGIWWDTWTESATIPNLDGGAETNHHIITFGTSTGKVYILRDTGAALVMPAVGSNWDTAFANGYVDEVTTLVVNDRTNLYFGALDGGAPFMIKININDPGSFHQVADRFSIAAQAVGALAWDTYSAETTLYGGTLANGGASYLYRMKLSNWSAPDASWSTGNAVGMTTDVTGYINVAGGHVYAGVTGGHVHCLQQDFIAEASGYPRQAATPGAIGRIAVYSGKAYWGQGNGYVVSYNGTGDPVDSDLLDGGQAFTAMPIYRSSTTSVYAANVNGKLYKLAGADLAVSHVYDFGAGISFTDIARDSGNDRLILGTSTGTFYVVVP